MGNESIENLKENLKGVKWTPGDINFLRSLLRQDDDDWYRSRPKPKNFLAKRRAKRKMAKASRQRNRQ